MSCVEAAALLRFRIRMLLIFVFTLISERRVLIRVSLLRAVLLLSANAMLTGCVAHCPCDIPDTRFPAFVQNREQFIDPPVTGGRTVYIFRPLGGQRLAPPVLVLHEYPALSASCLDFAQRLADQGFTVYVPVLFGNRQGSVGATALLGTTLELAFSPDWNVFVGEHEHSPITDWIRTLSRDIAKKNHHCIGVIGMCLTGSFPLALMSEDCVAAPVVCQPATPLLPLTPEGRRAIGISNEELQAGIVAAQTHGKKVFFTRYALDSISNEEKADNIKSRLGDLLLDHTICQKDYALYHLQKTLHATLTTCVQSVPARRLFQELVSFLHQRLD